MKITTCNPESSLRRPHKNFFEELLEPVLGAIHDYPFSTTMPSVNIKEESDKYTLEVAAPGLDKKDFHLNLKDDQLTIKAQKEYADEKTENDNFKRREFNYSSFERSFHLPDTVNVNDIEAIYSNGVLTIHLNKKESAVEQPARTIKIV